MAYQNFKQTIWSKYIEQQLPKFTVFEQDCDYKWKGEVKNGKTVKILGVGRPTIGDYTGADIGTPEAISDSAATLAIDHAKFFNFAVDDVDEAQSSEGLMEALLCESNHAMAEERDKFIAKELALGAGKTIAATITDKATAKKAVDEAIQWLWANGVSDKDNCALYLSPTVYMYLIDYMTEVKCGDGKLSADGTLQKYMGFKVRLTNNLHVDSTGKTYIILKTSRALAFASGIDSVEAYRPHGYFSDAVKGLNTFGGKVIRPNEICAIKY